MGAAFWTVMGRMCLQPEFRKKVFDLTINVIANTPADPRPRLEEVSGLYQYLLFPPNERADPQPVESYLLNRSEVMEVNAVLRSSVAQRDNNRVILRDGNEVIKRDAGTFLGGPGGVFDQIAVAWSSGGRSIGSAPLWRMVGLLCIDHHCRRSLVANGGYLNNLVITTDAEKHPDTGKLVSVPPVPIPADLIQDLTDAEKHDLQSFVQDSSNEFLLTRVDEEAWRETPVGNKNGCSTGLFFKGYRHSRGPL